MRPFTQNTLYRISIYWKLKKWLKNNLAFRIGVKVFSSKQKIYQNRKALSLFSQTLFQFMKTIIFSAVLICIFDYTKNWFPISFTLIDNKLSSNVSLLLSTIASVSGVFLGLYFTAISSIASNFLIRAPQNVRRFFLSAPKGLQYVKIIAMTGILSVYYILSSSFGYEIPPLCLILLALCTVYIIIRFWSVGSDVYNSLEPANSFPLILEKIINSIKGVSSSRLQSKTGYIQNHYALLASNYLDLIKDLISFQINELKTSDRQFIIALKHLTLLLEIYCHEKAKIPTNSLWYKTKLRFEDWSFADSTQVQVALQTGTALQPKAIKDFNWFEVEILEVASKIFDHFVSKENIGFILQAYQQFIKISAIYANDLDASSLKTLIEKLLPLSNSICFVTIQDSHTLIHKEQLAFIESQGQLAINALLGFSEYIRSQSLEDLLEQILDIDWNSNNLSYIIANFPLAMIPKLEELAIKLKNEGIIEGSNKSPEWYIRTLCIQNYVFALQDYFLYIKSLDEGFFNTILDLLVKEKQLTASVHLLENWLEYSKKYIDLVNLLNQHLVACSSFRGIKDLPWDEFNFIKELDIAKERAVAVEGKIIDMLPSLKNLEIGDSFPDYFGHALLLGMQTCYSCCKDNQSQKLEYIFLRIFKALLDAFDLTDKKIAKWTNNESKMIYLTEPLANLLELSGFAKLYSEFHQNPRLWEIVQIVWDHYLSKDNAESIIAFMSQTVTFRSRVFMIKPQDALRAQWQLDFDNTVTRFNGEDTNNEQSQFEMPIKHPSSLIRIITRFGNTHVNSQDVFISLYLSQVSAAKNIQFLDKYDIRRFVEQEESDPA